MQTNTELKVLSRLKIMLSSEDSEMQDLALAILDERYDKLELLKTHSKIYKILYYKGRLAREAYDLGVKDGKAYERECQENKSDAPIKGQGDAEDG